jgi:hypothetical protein
MEAEQRRHDVMMCERLLLFANNKTVSTGNWAWKISWLALVAEL